MKVVFAPKKLHNYVGNSHCINLCKIHRGAQTTDNEAKIYQYFVEGMTFVMLIFTTDILYNCIEES